MGNVIEIDRGGTDCTVLKGMEKKKKFSDGKGVSNSTAS